MLNAPGESPSDIGHRNIVAAFDDSLSHAADGFAHIRNPDEVQLDRVAELLRVLESPDVGSPAESGFERKSFAPLDQFAKFTEQEFSRFECNGFWFERRQTARDLIGVQEANDADAGKKFFGECCFAGAITAGAMR
jgi:hypothetical protein